MHQGLCEIVILRPSPVFLAFLASQLAEDDLPSMFLLKTDCTAYAIRKSESEEERLGQLEKYFPTMFRQEIARWLGNEAHNEIENKFLDFLCCFKMELHSHILLSDPDLVQDQQVLMLKPRPFLLHWLQKKTESQEDLRLIVEQVNLCHLTENATLLIKKFADLTGVKPFLQQHYQIIFVAAMKRFSQQENEWPVIDSWQSFNHYFAIEIHTRLIHLHDAGS